MIKWACFKRSQYRQVDGRERGNAMQNERRRVKKERERDRNGASAEKENETERWREKIGSHSFRWSHPLHKYLTGQSSELTAEFLWKEIKFYHRERGVTGGEQMGKRERWSQFPIILYCSTQKVMAGESRFSCDFKISTSWEYFTFFLSIFWISEHIYTYTHKTQNTHAENLWIPQAFIQEMGVDFGENSLEISASQFPVFNRFIVICIYIHTETRSCVADF